MLSCSGRQGDKSGAGKHQATADAAKATLEEAAKERSRPRHPCQMPRLSKSRCWVSPCLLQRHRRCRLGEATAPPCGEGNNDVTSHSRPRHNSLLRGPDDMGELLTVLCSLRQGSSDSVKVTRILETVVYSETRSAF